jgi:hypothetical protein
MTPLELRWDFLALQGIPLSLGDVAFGLERGWVHPPAVVAWACDRLAQGTMAKSYANSPAWTAAGWPTSRGSSPG